MARHPSVGAVQRQSINRKNVRTSVLNDACVRTSCHKKRTDASMSKCLGRGRDQG